MDDLRTVWDASSLVASRDRPQSALTSLQSASFQPASWGMGSYRFGQAAPPSAWPRPLSASHGPTNLDAAHANPLSLLSGANRPRPASAGYPMVPRSASAGRTRLQSPRNAYSQPGGWLATRPESADLENNMAVPPVRPVSVQAMARKPKEVLAEELVQARTALQRLAEENRLLATEKRRIEGQLMVARGNIGKAEELLNNKERSLNPQHGLSQMFRTPETTALVGKLRERMQVLTMERDSLQTQLKDAKMDMRSSRAAELLSERNVFSEEVRRQAAINMALLERLAVAEQSAAAAAAQATQATHTLKEHLRQGKGLPLSPPKLPSGNSLSKSGFGKTLHVLRACHSTLLSQAQLVRSVFPRHVVTWEDLDRRASSQSSLAGGGDVLRYLRTHIKRLAQELYGLPGATVGLDDEKAVESGQEPASYQQLLYGLAESVRVLRSMNPSMFHEDTTFEVDMEELAAVGMLLVDEVDRLRGAGDGSTRASIAAKIEQGSISSFWKRRRLPPYDSDAQHNPLYSTEPPASNEKLKGSPKTKALANGFTSGDEDAESKTEEVKNEAKGDSDVRASYTGANQPEMYTPGMKNLMWQRAKELEEGAQSPMLDISLRQSTKMNRGTSPCKDEGTQYEENAGKEPAQARDSQQPQPQPQQPIEPEVLQQALEDFFKRHWGEVPPQQQQQQQLQHKSSTGVQVATSSRASSLLQQQPSEPQSLWGAPIQGAAKDLASETSKLKERSERADSVGAGQGHGAAVSQRSSKAHSSALNGPNAVTPYGSAAGKKRGAESEVAMQEEAVHSGSRRSSRKSSRRSSLVHQGQQQGGKEQQAGLIDSFWEEAQEQESLRQEQQHKEERLKQKEEEKQQQEEREREERERREQQEKEKQEQREREQKQEQERLAQQQKEEQEQQEQRQREEQEQQEQLQKEERKRQEQLQKEEQERQEQRQKEEQERHEALAKQESTPEIQEDEGAGIHGPEEEQQGKEHIKQGAGNESDMDSKGFGEMRVLGLEDDEEQNEQQVRRGGEADEGHAEGEEVKDKVEEEPEIQGAQQGEGDRIQPEKEAEWEQKLEGEGNEPQSEEGVDQAPLAKEGKEGQPQPVEEIEEELPAGKENEQQQETGGLEEGPAADWEEAGKGQQVLKEEEIEEKILEEEDEATAPSGMAETGQLDGGSMVTDDDHTGLGSMFGIPGAPSNPEEEEKAAGSRGPRGGRLAMDDLSIISDDHEGLEQMALMGAAEEEDEKAKQQQGEPTQLSPQAVPPAEDVPLSPSPSEPHRVIPPLEDSKESPPSSPPPAPETRPHTPPPPEHKSQSAHASPPPEPESKSPVMSSPLGSEPEPRHASPPPKPDPQSPAPESVGDASNDDLKDAEGARELA